MAIITVDKSNIDTEHICCAITEKKGENCVASKKAWLKERFDDGLVFKKLDERGKVFIEYMPAERCFAPIKADGYMYISCFWVSGKFKGTGLGNELLEACIMDAKAKGKKGLVCLGSKKKMHFLTDPKFLKYKGFKICDTTDSGFELLYLPFDDARDIAISGDSIEISGGYGSGQSMMEEAMLPSFMDSVKTLRKDESGVAIYYSNGCPHTDKYIPIQEAVLKDIGVDYRIVKLSSVEEAQSAPAPCTNYMLFVDGEFIGSEIFTVKKLTACLERFGYVKK